MTCGVFTAESEFLDVPELDTERLEATCREAVFAPYLTRGEGHVRGGREHAELAAQRLRPRRDTA